MERLFVRVRNGLGAVLLGLLASCTSNRPVGAPIVHVVEEHPDALVVLARVSRESSAPAGGRWLVHLDSHADLGVPDPLRRPLVRDEVPAIVADDLAVDEVVVPAVFLGFVRGMDWVVPAAVDERERDERYETGSVGGRGRRLALGARLDELLYPDRVAFDVRVRRLARVAPPAEPWVLDVDLDYFACANPHRAHVDVEIGEADAKALLASTRVLDRGERVEAGRRTVSILLADPAGGPWPRRLDRIEPADGAVRWVLGWRCFGATGRGLPVHDPTDAELDAAIAELGAWLRAAPRPPDVVVIARSARSGFVPAKRVDEIQRRVLAALGEAGLVRARAAGRSGG